MKLATLLILSLVILGAAAQRGGSRRGGGGRGGGGRGGGRGKGKLLRTCDIDRDFCDRGQRPEIAPLDTDCERDYVGTEFERGEKPERDDCTVGETVTNNFCVLCVERRSREVISAVEYQISAECIDDCKRDKESCLDKENARCAEA